MVQNSERLHTSHCSRLLIGNNFKVLHDSSKSTDLTLIQAAIKKDVVVRLEVV